MRRLVTLALACICPVAVTAASAHAASVVGINRSWTHQPVGALLRFESDDPGHAILVGNTGLAGVGAMDFRDGQMWVAADNGGFLAFYTVDLSTATAVLIATTSEPLNGYIFGGAFGPDGRFWASNNDLETITSFDPLTGAPISSFGFSTDSIGGVGGLAFIGGDLFSLHTALPDIFPPGDGLFGRFDTQSGAFTPISTTGPCQVGAMGLDFDPAGGALLYTCITDELPVNSVLGALNPDSGTFVELGDVVPFAVLDAIAVVPEPSTVLLLGLGLIRLGYARRH